MQEKAPAHPEQGAWNNASKQTLVNSGAWLELSSDPAIAIEADLKVTGLNTAAEDLLGYTSEEVVGQRCFEVLQAMLPSGAPLCSPDCAGGACFAQRRPFSASTCRARRRDGRWVNIALSSFVIPSPLPWSARGTHHATAIIFLRPHAELEDERPETLRIFALGRFALVSGRHECAWEKWTRKHAVTALKYLVSQLGSPVHREQLMECLWPEVDETRGRARLKVTMHLLRLELGRAGAPADVVQTVRDGYLLRRDAVWVDAEAFERLAGNGRRLQRHGKEEEALSQYLEVGALYRGDYFEEDRYADWCAEERERLREIYLDVLARIAEIYARRGSYAEAADVCREALSRERCREMFHRALMTALFHLDRPDAALAQFQRCQRILHDELGVSPGAETRRLYEQALEAARLG